MQCMTCVMIGASTNAFFYLFDIFFLLYFRVHLVYSLIIIIIIMTLVYFILSKTSISNVSFLSSVLRVTYKPGWNRQTKADM